MFREQSLNVLQQQYGYTNISDLMMRKAAVWDKHLGNIAQQFVTDILDFNTCVPSALDYYWGKLLKISRTFTDMDGNKFSLTDEQFREIIKIRAFATAWDGTITTLNRFLGNLFADRGLVYMIDNLDMNAQVYVFTYRLEDWEKYLFIHKDVLPRVAGVGTAIYELTTDTLIGFQGSDFQSWPLYTNGTPNQNTSLWRGKTIYKEE
ncbi:MAG: DUF2612 domain-containing protein [Alphaproteobacteria bacterium]|nr:DUF2612 domain-containing protein [Alphaproteobacteria bacterium]